MITLLSAISDASVSICFGQSSTTMQDKKYDLTQGNLEIFPPAIAGCLYATAHVGDQSICVRFKRPIAIGDVIAVALKNDEKPVVRVRYENKDTKIS